MDDALTFFLNTYPMTALILSALVLVAGGLAVAFLHPRDKATENDDVRFASEVAVAADRAAVTVRRKRQAWELAQEAVDFGHGVRPHCPVYDRASGMLYVTTELDQTVTIIDPQTLKIVGTVPTGQKESHMLVISRDGRFGYTSNVGAGSVSVLDLHARKTVAIIPEVKTALDAFSAAGFS